MSLIGSKKEQNTRDTAEKIRRRGGSAHDGDIIERPGQRQRKSIIPAKSKKEREKKNHLQRGRRQN